jgi:prepilin-type N-terminal cleavage/methylation domain-containing protein
MKNAVTRYSRQKNGFTIIELMVASFITAISLLGIYATFKQVLEIEGTSSRAWQQRSAAEAVCLHLSEALENCINLPEIPTLSGDSNQFVCLIGGIGHDGENFQRAGIQRRRYYWQTDSENSTGLTLHLQTLKFAGTHNVTPLPNVEERTEEHMWTGISSQTIATRLDSVSLQYLDLQDQSEQWLDHWNGPVGNVAIRIRVTCQGWISEKIILPKVNRFTTKEVSS